MNANKVIDKKLGQIATEYDTAQPIMARLDARASHLNTTGAGGLDRALLVDAMLAISRLENATKALIAESEVDVSHAPAHAEAIENAKVALAYLKGFTIEQNSPSRERKEP